MTISRQRRIEQIMDKINTRKLVWFGTRGTDAQALFEIPQFSEIFSIIAPLKSSTISESCLETQKETRVDLEVYSIDNDLTTEALEFRKKMASTLKFPSVVITYRPGKFFSSIYYPRNATVEYLGLFHEKQAPFEHKPWVESELRKLGVQVIPWRYFGTYEDPDSIDITKGPVVLRKNRSDGGAGLTLVDNQESLRKLWPNDADCFVGIAPYMFPNIPLNVTACAFADGSVTLHTPSIQLIGIDGLTNRYFGYCGNDFVTIRDLDAFILDKLENKAKSAGKWLASMGYRGAFGVDAIFYNGDVYLTEINPRFQGSSELSAWVDKTAGNSDVFLEHIAAHLGMRESTTLSLKDQAKEQPKASQVVMHNCNSIPLHYNGKITPKLNYSMIPDSFVEISPDAVTCKLVFEDTVTKDGNSINQDILNYLTQVKLSFI
jgi:hypothetical protein